MTFPQRRWLGYGVLLAWAAMGAAWLLRLDYARAISTDVLDLIPANERDPELAVVRGLASEAEARTMLFVLTGAAGQPAPVEAARRFAAVLAAAPEFTQAIALADPGWREAAGRALFDLRFTLLFPSWLSTRAAGDLPGTAARELKAFLERPEALAFQDLVPADPLLLLPGALGRMKHGLALMAPAGDAGRAEELNTGLVWAQLAASPLSEAGQGPAFAAIARAAAAVGAGVGGGAGSPSRPGWKNYERDGSDVAGNSGPPGDRAPPPESGLSVAFTGVNRFAAASRTRIEREVSWLNALSLAAVLAVALIFIHGVHRALHLVPVVAFSVLGAWVATTLAFERVHVIVFVLGALLTGVAIDYGFYLYMQPPAGPGEDYPAKVRRLAKPLIASCATTVAGFALLLFSELPLIRQLGVFVGAGLVCALGAAVVYFATVENAFLETRAFRGGGALPAIWRRRLRLALIGCWIAALPGLARLTWRDDIRELEIPAPAIRAEDARIRAAFGQREDRTVFITHGATLDEARVALGALERWLGGRTTIAHLGAVIPLPAERAAAAAFFREHPEFPAALRAALAAEGFSVEEFEPFFQAWAEQAARPPVNAIDAAVRPLQAALRGPLGLLLHTGKNRSWFVSVARDGTAGLTPPAETQTVTASQLQSLNRLFANYRASALRLSLVGLAIVGLGVLLTYGVRDGIRIFAIPCGACLGIFELFGWIGQPLNLFHLLGAFLGVCLTHNYSIFSATSALRHEPPPVSVRLSALTTATSFGVLALSGIPVVRALGVTVAAMVIAALVVIELEHLSPLAKKAEA